MKALMTPIVKATGLYSCGMERQCLLSAHSVSGLYSRDDESQHPQDTQYININVLSSLSLVSCHSRVKSCLCQSILNSHQFLGTSPIHLLHLNCSPLPWYLRCLPASTVVHPWYSPPWFCHSSCDLPQSLSVCDPFTLLWQDWSRWCHLGSFHLGVY